MRIIKAIIVAFSMYSRIPMPRFEWAGEDMKYHLIFFPWVGAVIGLLEYLWLYICNQTGIEQLPFAAIVIVIPLVVTGGFHVDGYMDTADALSSWREKEKRLEILKDPHIGAFAVIKLLTAVLTLLAALLLMNKESFLAWIVTFFLARAFSGISVVRFKNAKKDGLLNTESETASQRVVFIALVVQLVAMAAALILFYPIYGIAIMVTQLLCFVWYKRVAMSKFGGITGDLAGWYVTKSEVWTALVCAILTVVLEAL